MVYFYLIIGCGEFEGGGLHVKKSKTFGDIISEGFYFD